MESETLPDISYTGPNLDVPNPPTTMGYEEYEDYRCASILEQNGISLHEESLTEALQSQRDLLLACVAHTAGARSARSTLPLLTHLLATTDDLVQVEAAYALARLGHSDGKDVLVRALERPVAGYLSTVTAAGYLAQLGDPRGFKHVREALGSELAAFKMLGCKQLYFFMPFHRRTTVDGEIDVVAQFGRALDDPDTNLQWQALVQMRQLKTPQFAPLLTGYVSRAEDPALRQIAEQIMQQWPTS